MPRIKLQKLVNCRDLGGFITKDSKRVREHRLIRSETLYSATQKDIETLTKVYGLKNVVDFRTDLERSQKPDPQISGVTNYINPILKEETLGITRENVEYRDMPKLFENISVSPLEYMQKMYRNIATDSHALEHYRKFFEILLSNEEGSTLWHCSAGKDRVGVGTALLLTALGVDREEIIQDYLMTSYYYRFTNMKLKALIRLGVRDKKVRDCLEYLLDVKREYIEAVFDSIEEKYGSVDVYLEKEMGLDEDNLNKLKRLYLE